MARVLNWNGIDLPDELRSLPAGRYVLEPVESGAPALTAEEEEGLRQALASLAAGKGRSPAEVQGTIDRILKR